MRELSGVANMLATSSGGSGIFLAARGQLALGLASAKTIEPGIPSFVETNKLKAIMDSITGKTDPMGELAGAVEGNDLGRVKAILARHPDLKSKRGSQLTNARSGVEDRVKV